MSWFNSPHRPDWKIGWWDEKTDFSVASQKRAKAEHNKDPQGAICGRKGDYRYPDWILSFGLTAKQAKEPEWIFVNFVVRHSTSKKEKYPFEAVQVDSNRERPPPPFSLGRGFSKALNTACRQFGIENLKDLRRVQPPKKFLHLLRDAMSRQTQK